MVSQVYTYLQIHQVVYIKCAQLLCVCACVYVFVCVCVNHTSIKCFKEEWKRKKPQEKRKGLAIAYSLRKEEAINLTGGHFLINKRKYQNY